MGLDLALLGLILFAGLRGWFRGFVLPAVRIGGLIVCVYAADPLRDVAKPEIAGYLPTIRPDLVDRMLWWSAALISYVVLVGLASLVVKIYRRKPYGLEEANRSDQIAGLFFGLARGGVMAALLVAAIDAYALDHLKEIRWAAHQVKDSMAVAWNRKYQPVAKVWDTPPVQHFVNHVRKQGLNKSEAGEAPEPEQESKPLQTASRSAKREWDASSRKPTSGDVAVGKAVELLKDAISDAKPAQ